MNVISYFDLIPNSQHSFEYNQDEAFLVHYDGGYYGRGADKKLTRLQIIKQHNRL